MCHGVKFDVDEGTRELTWKGEQACRGRSQKKKEK